MKSAALAIVVRIKRIGWSSFFFAESRVTGT
jgi:hypothetical protein